MQNDKICSEIVGALARTRGEANILLAEVDILMRAQYKTGDADFNHAMESLIRAKTATAFGQVITKENCSEVLASIKEKTEALAYLGLTLAFEPNLEIVGKISTWAKQNIDQNIALDIKLDRSILGGAVIEYKGKVRGFTILSQIDNYFSTNYANF